VIAITVIVPTHRPHPDRLARTLAGLAAQSLSCHEWETLLIDNANEPPIDFGAMPLVRPDNLRIIREPRLGLTAARRSGFQAASGELCILVDDDNVLAPDFLENALRIFREYPRLGAAGGPSRPEFEVQPAAWVLEFLPLLALRDLGEKQILATLTRSADGTHHLYPACAPIGAGLTLRRSLALAWTKQVTDGTLTDRCGSALTSGGDNDIVLHLLHAGWQVGYFPELSLTHLIPGSRLDPAYLARLNHGIQKSWVQVLSRHNACAWPAIRPATVAFRCARAWWRQRAWRGPAERIRWRGLCGHFAGRASIHSTPSPTP
jgi:GT2 family glycosyltransferase